jgi:exosortase
LHEANPIWRLTSLLLALEVISLTLGVIYLLRGSAGLRDFAFPVAFFIVAIPWPTALEGALVQSLTRVNTCFNIEMLGLLGVPALQHGNVIEIRAGMVGIDGACSGIRSFQATLMLALYFGEVFRLTILRRVTLCLLGFILSLLFNIIRMSLLSYVVARNSTAVLSSWHDPAGATILVACFVCLWFLAQKLKFVDKSKNNSCSTASPTQTAMESRAAFCSTRFLTLIACAIGVWLILVEVGTEVWFRSHEQRTLRSTAWGLNSEAHALDLTSLEIPRTILDQFRADEVAHKLWRDKNGNMWQLYYFRWLPAHSVNKRVAIQLAKTHGPEICLPAIGMPLKADVGVIQMKVGDTMLALQQYLFTVEGQSLQVFYGIYEDSSGPGVLANRRLDSWNRVSAALAGSRNYGQRFLEIAEFGPIGPGQARAALKDQLEQIIKLDKR